MAHKGSIVILHSSSTRRTRVVMSGHEYMPQGASAKRLARVLTGRPVVLDMLSEGVYLYYPNRKEF